MYPFKSSEILILVIVQIKMLPEIGDFNKFYNIAFPNDLI